MITPETSTPKLGPHAPLPQPGVGTGLVRYDGLGYVIGGSRGGAHYGHPFKPFLSGSRVSFSHGLVEVFTPKIGTVPMNGDGKRGAPTLKLDPAKANKAGESWACIEVEPTAKGELTKDSRIEIIHTDYPFSGGPKVGRIPITLILWKDGRPLRALPIVQFNLRYVRVSPAPGGGAVRHLFL